MLLLEEEKGRRNRWWLLLCWWLCVWHTNSSLLTFNPNKPIRGQALYLSVTSQKRFIVPRCWHNRTCNVLSVETLVLEMGASHWNQIYRRNKNQPVSDSSVFRNERTNTSSCLLIAQRLVDTRPFRQGWQRRAWRSSLLRLAQVACKNDIKIF
jgi:hypothetical protein